MPDTEWTDLGPVDELKRRPLYHLVCEKTKIALTYGNNQFSAISGVCNHVGGRWAMGRLRAIMSSAPGITGNFIGRPVKARQAMSRTVCRSMPSRWSATKLMSI